MPTKKKRVNVTDTNAPPALKPDDIVPSVYTGQKLLEKDPARYSRVVQELAAGKPVSRIAKDNRISPCTVSAILNREKDTVKAVEDMTKSLTQYASQTALIRLIDKLEKDEIPVGLLPICWGVLRDHTRKDAGQPTQTIEVKKSLTLEDVKRELAEFKADAVEVEVEDLGSDKPETKEEPE